MELKSYLKNALTGAILFLGTITASQARATIVTYPLDLPGFNAEMGNPPIVVNLDSIVPNTDITGNTISGIRFLRGLNSFGPGADLLVVPGSDTVTPSGVFVTQNTNLPIVNTSQYKLSTTYSSNVLSPGGIVLGPGLNNPVENDSMIVEFVDPVAAFGLQLLYQSLDADSYLWYYAYDSSNNLLSSGLIPASSPLPGNAFDPGAPGGEDFWGIVSSENNIRRIEFDEQDDNNIWPDSNIGYAAFRVGYRSPNVIVPEPESTIGLVILGLGSILWKIWAKYTPKS
ncbi:hypothetical protein V0288_05945 [Pannus brasiliensis CCIBt3594]|uniref:PEP-CTERM sorting domain-containing protein n=1 Tax=Pannus brasiliensis CCIBt3594 TaxID=1427578 RepID=A0AAW9QTK5_9CHRO